MACVSTLQPGFKIQFVPAARQASVTGGLLQAAVRAIRRFSGAIFGECSVIIFFFSMMISLKCSSFSSSVKQCDQTLGKLAGRKPKTFAF